jgi:predicted RNA-binding Zn-ribbon protein involved in translation (DUF1610 family)
MTEVRCGSCDYEADLEASEVEPYCPDCRVGRLERASEPRHPDDDWDTAI